MGAAATTPCTSTELSSNGDSISRDRSGAVRKSRTAETAPSGGSKEYWYDKMRLSAASQTIFEGAQCGDTRRVLAALNAHGDPNCVNFMGYTALVLAVGGGHREVVALMLQASANPNYAVAGLTPLMVAAAGGQVEMVRMLVNCGASTSPLEQKNGRTALHRACARGHGEATGLLLQAGASVDLGDFKGLTPLMLCVEGGHTESARTVLCAGASMALYDRAGNTALIKSVAHMHEACLDLLLKAGAPVNVGAKETGDTALIHAARRGGESFSRRLLQFKANVNLPNQQRETPLMVASEAGHVEVVHMLLLSGADTTFQDVDGHTALMRAAEAGHVQVSTLAVDFGANPSFANPVDRESAVTVAARSGYPDIYRVLVAAGGKVGATDEAQPEFSLQPVKAA
jgi:ankyrin repeat protein